ncbi:MAG: transposase [Peptoclostridium sp.]|uniref:transposase n=1 Tax=Peptoclostridium sp. TaxID=1904860 RepID=UPI00139DD36A|nr:transposase [Peptoclostridium sp.]MZQ75410.1 transposase [Peptoclostridium sp.]
MKVSKTLKNKITTRCDAFVDTLGIYRSALSFAIKVIDAEWSSLSACTTVKSVVPLAELLMHKTADNPNQRYGEFDKLFYKFPSYFRRSAIADAYGIVKSHRSNLSNWELKKAEFEAKGKTLKDKPPTLSYSHYAFPVFYKKNMFIRTGENSASIKVFKGGDWVWQDISFKGDSLKRLVGYKECSPSLVKKGRRFYLHTPCKATVTLCDKKPNEQTIIAVDLGLTNTAVCCAMKADGTVIGRLFINQPVEKDRMLSRLGRLKKAQQQSCINSKNKLPNHWRKINNLQKQIVQDTVNKIVAFAQKYGATAIVFEYLGKFKHPRGKTSKVQKLRLKLQHWAKNRIQDKVKHKAHSLGIRFSRVVAANTSKLAFDGSGAVIRNAKQDLCEFKTGKKYHADLNASYNIGARYFIGAILKTCPEKDRSQAMAKVPELASRTRCVLASLISLVKAI